MLIVINEHQFRFTTTDDIEKIEKKTNKNYEKLYLNKQCKIFVVTVYK